MIPVSFNRWRCLAAAALLSTASFGFAQVTPPSEAPATRSTLSLLDVVNLARERNGTILSAYYTYLASRQNTIVSKASLLPLFVPSYTYTSDRVQVRAGGQNSYFQQSEVGAYNTYVSYRFFDLGERQYNYLSAKYGENTSYDNARQTLRQELYNVQDDYYETLRANELQKVQDAEVSREATIVDQTQAQIEVGSAAKKDKLQALADLANARVAQLQARNQVSNNSALLKSVIGYPSSQALPALEEVGDPDTSKISTNLNQVLDDGLRNRPDIVAYRDTVRSLEFLEKYYDRIAGITFNVDGSFGYTFSPDQQQQRTLTLTLSYPVFDGGNSRALAREAAYNVKAERAQLLQAERAARAQIESDFLMVSQDVERLKAANDALVAAQENYTAAVESQKAGAENIIDVLTAQVSLVTAESNKIQAIYDFYIAQLGLNLSTGQPLLGEPVGGRLGNPSSSK